VRHVPGAAGAERACTADTGLDGPWWTATAGGHRLDAVVDDIEVLPETNETNNTRSVTIRVS
jgi:hypothetical protein